MRLETCNSSRNGLAAAPPSRQWRLNVGSTVNVDIFALYILSRNSGFLDIRENMYTMKITFIIA